jgi:MoxR-like ATPase
MRSHDAASVLALSKGFGERVERMRREVARVIVGQDRVVDELLMTLLAGGHALIEGVPGLAKTLLVNTLSQALSLDSGRVQFTPDLMPSDIVGSQVIVQHVVGGDSARSFRFQKGPVFVNMLLADEINRTPPKTQAALLEAMAERRVSLGGQQHVLPQPFFVLATQNPIEQEGTYNLPEAQLDRFLTKITIDYPTFEEERAIVKRTTANDPEEEVTPCVSREEILTLQELVRQLPASRHVIEYATRLVRRSRPTYDDAPAWVREQMAWGAGPRAAQSLIMAAKARTLIQGRFAVTRADVRDVALPVLRHRLLTSFPAEAKGLTVDDLVCQLLLDTPSFPEVDGYDAATQAILRL